MEPIRTRELVSPIHRPEGDALRGIDRMIAVEEIRTTKARYCRTMDDRDWDGVRGVFTADCLIDWPLPEHDIRTADAFVDFLAGAIIGPIRTRHHIHNLLVEFVSPDEALVRWDHENWTWFEDGSGPNMQQWGQYREKYRRTEQGWLISYFSEQHLFNAPAPKRRPAGIGDGGTD